MWRFALIQFLAAIGLRLAPTVAEFFKRNKYLALIFFYLCVIGIVFSLFVGCSTLGSFFNFTKLPELNEKDVYRHELVMDVNGQRIEGSGVAEAADVYKIRVYPPGNVDRITWRTCNREVVIDKPKISNSCTSWCFGAGYNYLDIEYQPVSGLEDVNSCALKIEVLEEKKRRNALALIEFKNKREEVSQFADMTCNGKFSQIRGVGICQAAAGLYQKISFPSPSINRNARPECDVMKPLDGSNETIYQFPIAQGECVYTFVTNERAQNGKRRELILTTIGYTDVPPMKE